MFALEDRLIHRAAGSEITKVLTRREIVRRVPFGEQSQYGKFLTQLMIVDFD